MVAQNNNTAFYKEKSLSTFSENQVILEVVFNVLPLSLKKEIDSFIRQRNKDYGLNINTKSKHPFREAFEKNRELQKQFLYLKDKIMVTSKLPTSFSHAITQILLNKPKKGRYWLEAPFNNFTIVSTAWGVQINITRLPKIWEKEIIYRMMGILFAKKHPLQFVRFNPRLNATLEKRLKSEKLTTDETLIKLYAKSEKQRDDIYSADEKQTKVRERKKALIRQDKHRLQKLKDKLQILTS